MNILVICYGEMIRIVRSRTTYVLYIATPLLLIGILGSALSGMFGGHPYGASPATVVISAAGSGEALRQVSEELQRLEENGLANVERVERREEVETALKSAQADYGVVLLETKANGPNADLSWELMPGKSQSKNVVLESVFRAIASGQSADEAPLPDSGQVLREALRPYSAMQYYSSAILVMFLLYSGMTAAISFIGEKERHTLERLNTTPVGFGSMIAGKMLAHGAIAILQAAIIIAATHWGFGVYWGDRLGWLALASLFTVVASMSLALLGASFFTSVKIASGVFQTLVILMTFSSGSFSPNVGEDVLQFGRWTLSYLSTRCYLRLMIDSPDHVILQHLSWLGIAAGGLFVLSILCSRRASFR